MTRRPFELDPGAWLKDPGVCKCSPWTRGIWIDLLCSMHESDRCGRVEGTVDQLARVARCGVPELNEALEELKESKTAEVDVLAGGAVRVTNRRMRREWERREACRKRQERRRHASVTRMSQKSNANVTRLSRGTKEAGGSTETAMEEKGQEMSHGCNAARVCVRGSLSASAVEVSDAEIADGAKERAAASASVSRPGSAEVPAVGYAEHELAGRVDVAYPAPCTVQDVAVALHNRFGERPVLMLEIAESYWNRRDSVGWKHGRTGSRILPNRWIGDAVEYARAVMDEPRFAAKWATVCTLCWRVSDACECDAAGREDNWVRRQVPAKADDHAAADYVLNQGG